MSDTDESTAPPEEKAASSSPDERETANLRLMSGSSLFDAQWYSDRYPEAADSGLEPALHYLRSGAAKGFAPSPGFDGAGYLARYPDIARTGMNPLVHFLSFGRAEGRVVNGLPPAPEPPSPHAPPPAAAPSAPDPAAAREAANARIVRDSSLFDAAWYGRRHPEAASSGVSPELHYLRAGAAKGYPPSAMFDAAEYLERYQDVRDSGINPVIHYEMFGKSGKRRIKPWDEDAAVQRMALSSGLFDEAWYLETYPDVRKSKLSSLAHYLRHGRAGNRNPGPDFDAAAYIAANAEVAASAINPLVHYLLFGKNEGRPISKVQPAPPPAAAGPEPEPEPSKPEAIEPAPPRRPINPATPPEPPEPPVQTPEDIAADLKLIQDSPLFDRGWYLRRYPEVARSAMTAAEHYLRNGGPEMRQPSLLFDPQYYSDQSPVIQQTGINPLLHYIKEGQALGRKPRALFESMVTPDDPVKPLSPALWPLAAAPEPVPAPPAWTTHAELGATPPDGSIHAGAVLLACPPEASIFEGVMARLTAFSTLSGSAGLTLRRGENSEAIPQSVPHAAALGSGLTSGPAQLADGWYATDFTLRLRFGEDNPADSQPTVLRGFQCGADGAREPALIGEALLAADGPSFVDLALVNPFMPVLLVLSRPDGETVDAGLLPFPSLLRGGLHHSELVGASQLSDPRDQFCALSDGFLRAMRDETSGAARLVGSLSIGITGAAGTEPAFQPEFTSWLSRVFGLSLKAVEGTDPATAGEAYLRRSLTGLPILRAAPWHGQFDLTLPPDSAPTIAALTAAAVGSDALHAHAGSYFVADNVSTRPRLSVQLPDRDGDLRQLQPGWATSGYPQLTPLAGSEAKDQGAAPLPHLAIRFPASAEVNRAAMLMPLAPDFPASVIASAGHVVTVDAVIRVSNPKRLAALLGSLLRQAGVEIGQIRADIAMGTVETEEIDAVLTSMVPGRGSIRHVTQHLPIGPASLIEGSASAFTLAAEDSIVLHDPRCVAALGALAAAERTASAACAVLREVSARRTTVITFESGGYFPSHVSLLSAPALIVTLPDCRQALPNMTYPVIANDPALVLLSNAALRDVAAPAASPTAGVPDIFAFSFAALAQGYRHLCTTAVRASVLGAPPPREASDPPGIQAFGPADWQRVLSAVTVLRELH